MKKVIVLNLLSMLCLLLCACGAKNEHRGYKSKEIIESAIKEIRIENEVVGTEEYVDEEIGTVNIGGLADISICTTEEMLAQKTEMTTEEESVVKTEITTEEETTMEEDTNMENHAMEDVVVEEPTTQASVSEEPVTEEITNDTQNETNYFFNDMNYYQEAGDTVTIRPRYVYWEGDKLVAECYVVNSVDRPVYNIDVKRLSFSNDSGNTYFADATFGVMNNATIDANSYIIWTFVFSGDVVLSPGESLQTLLCNCNVSYYY